MKSHLFLPAGGGGGKLNNPPPPAPPPSPNRLPPLAPEAPFPPPPTFFPSLPGILTVKVCPSFKLQSFGGAFGLSGSPPPPPPGPVPLCGIDDRFATDCNATCVPVSLARDLAWSIKKFIGRKNSIRRKKGKEKG